MIIKNGLELAIPRFLNEWKNVSDDVIEIANYIVDKIIKDSENAPIKYGKISWKPVLINDDTLKIHINQNNVNQTINVKYILYNVQTDYDYDIVMKALNVNLNCEWDEDTKTLTLVSVLVNRQPNNKFQQSVIHEIEHMYQYFRGMEKRINLYDKCVDMYKNGDTVTKFIGLGLYYTFKHEQDAYVQQFYRHLSNYHKNMDIDDVLSEYEPFLKLNNVYDFIDKQYDNDYANKRINELGYSRKNYYKRLYFGYKRLLKKLENAYDRWRYENKDKFLTPNQHLNEALSILQFYSKFYKNDITNTDKYLTIEPFYRCYYK